MEFILMFDFIFLIEKKYLYYSVVKISEFNGDYNMRFMIVNEYIG